MPGPGAGAGGFVREVGLGGAPAWAVFACLKCDQILKCFVAVVKVNRFNWMKNLTRAQA